MQTKLKKIHIILLSVAVVLIFGFVKSAQAATYEIPLSVISVNGNSYCGGNPCRGGDTLIIKGGDRQTLKLYNFNGKGSYIVVKNESFPALPVNLRGQNNGTGWAILSIDSSKYLSVQGKNNSNYKYGIKANNGALGRSAAVHVYGESEHIKLGGIEVSYDGTTSIKGTGFRIQHDNLDWTFNDIEIHDSFIRDAPYAAMYLGHNKPWEYGDPYVANISVHNNIIKNPGGYGVTIKGSLYGKHTFYNNTVDTTGNDNSLGWDHKCVGFQHYRGTATAEAYNNKLVNCDGVGIKVGEVVNNLPVYIHDNEIFDVGANIAGYTEDFEGSGIATIYASDAIIKNNLILNSKYSGIKDKWYGVYAKNSTDSIVVKNNIIGGWATRAVWIPTGVKYVESNTDYSQIISDLNFAKWSDDGNYYNDDFTISSIPPASSIRFKTAKVTTTQIVQPIQPAVQPAQAPPPPVFKGVASPGSQSSTPPPQTPSAQSPPSQTAVAKSAISTSVAGAITGLVPCGNGSNPNDRCTLCHLIIGIYNIIKWGRNILVAVALTALVAGGIMYIVSAGNQQTMETAKNIVKQALWGVVIVLGAWLIINTGMWLLETKKTSGIEASGGWNNFSCT